MTEQEAQQLLSLFRKMKLTGTSNEPGASMLYVQLNSGTEPVLPFGMDKKVRL